MADSVPSVDGPKLLPFSGDFQKLIFVRQLSTNEGHSSHGRVFEVKFSPKRKTKMYALKVFNFYTLGELQPSVPLREHLLDGNTVLHHIDPFFAECRAFGQLCEAGKDGALAVRCHGYAFLPPEIEARIAEKFGIEKWNRKAEHEGQPLRAIFKDIIRFKSPFGKTDFPADSPFGQRKFSEMRNNIEQINKLGILIMDVRKENFRCGRLFDFSAAITSPHIALDQNLRPKKAILKTMRFDLECFDSLLEKEMKQAKKAKKERERQAAKKAQEAKAVSLA